MILKTFARIFTEDLPSSLTLLERMTGLTPSLRVAFLDMEVVVLGDFCFLAGPRASLRPFLGAVGPVLVDDLAGTRAELVAAGAEIVQDVTAGPTGSNLFSRSSDGVRIEWLEWTAAVRAQVDEAIARNAGARP